MKKGKGRLNLNIHHGVTKGSLKTECGGGMKERVTIGWDDHHGQLQSHQKS